MSQQAPTPLQNAAQIMEVSNEIKNLSKQAQSLDTISQQLQQTSQQQPPMKVEGFQSYQNPYNSPNPVSPNTQQTYEYRLGRRSLVDQVMGLMNI